MQTFNFGNITIGRIKELSFNINEEIINPNVGTPFQSQIGIKFGHNVDANIVDLSIRVFYHYPDNSPEKLMCEIVVQNVFVIPELSQYKKEENVILPKPLITSLVAISVSHTRALLSKNLAGTPLNDSHLVLIDPEAVAKHFFPYMFEQQDEEIK